MQTWIHKAKNRELSWELHHNSSLFQGKLLLIFPGDVVGISSLFKTITGTVKLSQAKQNFTHFAFPQPTFECNRESPLVWSGALSFPVKGPGVPKCPHTGASIWKGIVYQEPSVSIEKHIHLKSVLFFCAFLNDCTSGKTENIHLHLMEVLVYPQQQHHSSQFAHCPFDAMCLLLGDHR